MTKNGLAHPNNVKWFHPNSKLGFISGFVGFTQFNPPKPEVLVSGYSPKIARRNNILHVQKTQARKLGTTQRCNRGKNFGATSAIFGRICPPLIKIKLKLSIKFRCDATYDLFLQSHFAMKVFM